MSFNWTNCSCFHDNRLTNGALVHHWQLHWWGDQTARGYCQTIQSLRERLSFILWWKTKICGGNCTINIGIDYLDVHEIPGSAISGSSLTLNQTKSLGWKLETICTRGLRRNYEHHITPDVGHAPDQNLWLFLHLLGCSASSFLTTKESK